MNRTTSQKELDSESIALKRNVTQALEDMVNFEEEEEEEDIEEEEEENTNNFAQIVGGYFLGVTVGVLIAYDFSRVYKWKK